MIISKTTSGVSTNDDSVTITLNSGHFAVLQTLVEFHSGSYTSQDDAPFDIDVFEELLELIV